MSSVHCPFKAKKDRVKRGVGHFHSLNKYLLSIYYMPCQLLCWTLRIYSSEDTDMVSGLMSLQEEKENYIIMI